MLVEHYFTLHWFKVLLLLCKTEYMCLMINDTDMLQVLMATSGVAE